MDAGLNKFVDYEFRLLKDMRDKYARRLLSCEGLEKIRLRKVKRRNGRVYYYIKYPGSSKYVYLGVDGSPEVSRVKEAHFLKEALRRVDNNIGVLSELLERFIPYDIYSVNASLPKAYQDELLPVSHAYQVEGEKWKNNRLAFQAEFPENYPNLKTRETSDGVMVKTLSELIIYERLKTAGLYLIYELPLVLKDYRAAMYPDLTVLSPIDMKTEIIVEYVGLLDQPKYREDFARKVERYISNGYIPGVNLFFIFGDKNGQIDPRQINKLIMEIKGI